MDNQKTFQKIKEKLSNRYWRLNNLYYITDKAGNKVRFQMNDAQKRLYADMHYYNVILKARQLGFTTFICIYFLDACLFNSNHTAGIIAHTRDDASKIFKSKIKFAYENLPDDIKEARSATSDSARELTFSNGSRIDVGTSLRSGTYQKLLVSEYGKVSARYPEKAAEIKTGALNTVEAGQQIFIESTAEGQQGEFYDVVQVSRKLKESDTHLSSLDPKFHFYAWWEDENYILGEQDISNTIVTLEHQDYFTGLEAKGIKLSPAQKAWYVKKSATQGDLMKREYPSTPDEAFEASMEGAFYTKQMMQVRKNKQIGHFPHEPSRRVFTFWDIGLNDEMSIWFMQHIGHEYRFIHYYENSGEGYEHYANYLQSLGYVYERHYWPHDGNKRILGAQVTTGKNAAMELGIRPIEIVPRTNDVMADINNHCRPALTRCFFHEIGCSEGIKYLDNYRKEWDDKLGLWKDKPRHDRASNCADAFRTFAMGFKQRQAEFVDFAAVQEFAADYDPLEY